MNLREVIAELLKTPEVAGMQVVETPSTDGGDTGGNTPPIVTTTVDDSGNTPPADGAGATKTVEQTEIERLRLQIEQLQQSNKALLNKTDVGGKKQIDPILAICGIDIGGKQYGKTTD